MKNVMKEILEDFEPIWKKAQAINTQRRAKPRFHKIYQTRKKFVTIGLYDSVTKRWSTFESINLSGNFRYNNKRLPPEIREMREMVEAAS